MGKRGAVSSSSSSSLRWNQPTAVTMEQPLQDYESMLTLEEEEDNVISTAATPNPSPRSLDDVLEDAARPSNKNCLRQWRYWRIFCVLGVCNSSDATEILSLSYLLAHPGFQQQMLGQKAWHASALASAVFVGMLVGGLWVGVEGEENQVNSSGNNNDYTRRGRKPALVRGLAANALAGTLAAFTVNVYQLSLLRFVAGLGIGYSIPPMFTLCSELAPARDRGFWGVVVASFWMVGSIYVAVMGWLILDYWNNNFGGGIIEPWRVLALVCALPSAVGWITVQTWVPESPRWLLSLGQHDKAVQVVQHVTHETLRYRGPPWTVAEAMQQYPLDHHHSRRRRTEDAQPQQQQPQAFQSSPSSSSNRPSSSSWRVLTRTCRLQSFQRLYTRSLRRATIPLQTIWFTLSFASYGLSTWINSLFVQIQLQNIYGNALLFALSTVPGNVLSAALLDRVGRSTLLVASLVVAALSLLSFAYIAAVDNDNDNTSLPKGLVVLSACVFQCCSVVAWSTLAVLTPELFDTPSRNTGLGVCGASGRIGAMVAQWVNGFTLQTPARLLSIAAANLLVGALAPLCCLPPDKTRQSVDDNSAGLSMRVEHFSNGTDHNSSNGEDDDDDEQEREPFQPSHQQHQHMI